ncbi:MAG TPA: PilN domain-containing protein [Dictyoglomaceae bacterium]|nr:PilN domain-containing protein [Dictyoglomaceae bacterium]HOP95447.1 PilN domain-containing protein [Dictyoglomaceae bacterium]HPP15602.1 PilN domain-containing protein [Dictyoglomaceae bacterium]HPU42918.1 PilN domain-containing protein [Dictyoglomaceae bacterium]
MIGLYWKSGKLKVSEISSKGGKLSLKNEIEIDIPEGDFWNRGRGEAENISQILGSVLKENSIKDKEVYITFESKDFSVRSAEYPKMPLKELEMSILDDLEEYQAFSLENGAFTFSTLEEVKERLRLLILTLPKIIISTWENIIEKLGLSLIGLEPASFSGLRYILFSKNLYDSVIFIGNETTDIFFFSDDGRLNSVINLSVGVNDLSYNGNLNLESAIASWREEIITYLNSAFYNSETLNIAIFGEDERFKTFAEILSENLSSYSVEIIDNLDIPLMGLGLVKEKIIPDVNFVKKKGIKIDKELITTSLLLFILAISLLFPVNFYLNLKIKDLNSKIANLETEISKYNDEVSKLRKDVDDSNLLLQSLESWLQKKETIAFPSIFLSDLKSFVPKKVWLSSVDISPDKKIVIEGYSLDTEGVADFLLSLSQYPLVNSVKLESSVFELIGDSPVQKFRIVSNLK